MLRKHPLIVNWSGLIWEPNLWTTEKFGISLDGVSLYRSVNNRHHFLTLSVEEGKKEYRQVLMQQSEKKDLNLRPKFGNLMVPGFDRAESAERSFYGYRICNFDIVRMPCYQLDWRNVWIDLLSCCSRVLMRQGRRPSNLKSRRSSGVNAVPVIKSCFLRLRRTFVELRTC